MSSYDVGAMKAAVERMGSRFTIFGGEPLLLPARDLEDLWSWGLEKFHQNGIQTNGTLINDDHIRMFRRYRVAVGISIDGPGGLNSLRWAGSPEATREATEKTEAAIRRLCQEKIYPSLIVTLHRLNAAQDKLPVLAHWFMNLDRMGVHTVRLHILEVDDPDLRSEYALTAEHNTQAFLYLEQSARRHHRLRFDVFRDIRSLLVGNDRDVTCTWKTCDFYATQAVRGVEGNGRASNCGRTYKSGINYVKADRISYERYIALAATAKEDGGCKGCRYFVMCKGQCPGTALEGDWRNRSEYCAVWMRLLEYAEDELRRRDPDSIVSGTERQALEARFIDAWSNGQDASMAALLEGLRGRPVPSNGNDNEENHRRLGSNRRATVEHCVATE
jgi:uncharacterized protein